MIAWIGVGVAAAGLVLVTWLLVTRRLREKYAVLWILVALVTIAIGVFPGIVDALTQALGVVLPANLVFAVAIALLLGVSLHLSWELSQVEDETRRAAEEIAILRADLEALAGRLELHERHTQEGARGSSTDTQTDPNETPPDETR